MKRKSTLRPLHYLACGTFFAVNIANAQLRWDANGTTAAQTNGAGAWLTSNQWWNGTTNVTWTSGSDAVFGGVNSAGGAVTLSASTVVGSMTFNQFTGTYTLGSSANALTINSGITVNSNAGNVSYASPVTLGTSQTWTIASGKTVTMLVNSGLALGANTLTISGAGNLVSNAAVISGTGGIIMDGTGRFTLGANPGGSHTFSGPLTVNSGVVMFQSATTHIGNITLNGGVMESYWRDNPITRGQGTAANQIQITGGESGFGVNNADGTSPTFNIGAITWGSATFNPSKFVLQTSAAQANSKLTFSSAINLDGAVRTIIAAATTATPIVTISGIISNGSTTASGLTKEGTGRLTLSVANTFNGPTTISAGMLSLTNASALQNSVLATSASVTGGTNSGLRVSTTTLTLGGLTGNKDFDDISGSVFTTSTPGYSAVTALTLNPGTGLDFAYTGAIGNGAANMTLTKNGVGAQTLGGTNSYTGATNVSVGTLRVNGSTHSNSAFTVASGATLAGAGTVGGTVAINSGIIAPGSVTDAIGTLNVGGNTTWTSAGSANQFQFNLSNTSTSSDKLAITGDFTKGTGTIFRFNFMGAAPEAARTYDLITWTGTTGFAASDFSFTGLGGLYTSGAGFTITGTTLQFTAVPEASNLLIGGLLGLGLMSRRRKNA